MKIALYTEYVESSDRPLLESLVSALAARQVETVEFIDQLPEGAFDFVFSFGGDGTILSAVHLVVDTRIPIVGINFGHLGFLTTVGKSGLDLFVDDLLAGRYTIEERTLVHARVDGMQSFALNEVFVHRAENVPLLRTDVYVDDEFVSTYSGDGLIVATPTGSTAYSLSCGGPILTPNSGCFVITPIGAHSLTLRPFIVPDSAQIRLVTDIRHSTIYLGMDSRSQALRGGTEIHLRREDFTIRLVRMSGQNFFSACHDKLHWGSDIRR
ncbi:MAG: NAD(+)/NADH kinase [Bacteroidales bacterium]|nr:NAD(+)/NADH kinase [Bacteroidales bacterium]